MPKTLFAKIVGAACAAALVAANGCAPAEETGMSTDEVQCLQGQCHMSAGVPYKDSSNQMAATATSSCSSSPPYTATVILVRCPTSSISSCPHTPVRVDGVTAMGTN